MFNNITVTLVDAPLGVKISMPIPFSFCTVLTGIELIFFTAAGIGLCFGFVLENADNSGMF